MRIYIFVFVILAGMVLLCIQVRPIAAKPRLQENGVDQYIAGANLNSSTANFSYEFLKNTTILYADGRGDYGVEYRLKNNGISNIESFGWYFDWPSGAYSNIFAWDDIGPLQTQTSRTGSRIDIEVYFRNPISPGSLQHFFLGTTINNIASVNGNNGRANWYIIPTQPVREFIQGVTFPSNSTFSSISPNPDSQNGTYLEWRASDTASDWRLIIDVFYTTAPSTLPDPFLDLPINYDGVSFDVVAQGISINSKGKVTSWFDHSYPNYGQTGEITSWTGQSLKDVPDIQCTYGLNCYDGHNGIDLQHDKSLKNEPVLAAATGKVAEVCSTNPCSRGAGYGKYVLIDHQNGYATLYAHLASVNSQMTKGAPIQQRQIIGVMGGTGGHPVHLHFGVYYDNSITPTWSEKSAVVDPYGWRGSTPDPAAELPLGKFPPNRYLWKYNLGTSVRVDSTGDTIFTPSRNAKVSIPSNALSEPVIVELLNSPPLAAPSAQFKSTGNSFLLRLSGQSGNKQLSLPAFIASQNEFAASITITVNYQDNQLLHLNKSQLVIHQWDESRKTWTALPTTIDEVLHLASASTLNSGNFDLQAPLLCSADVYERDDTYDFAQQAILGTPQLKLLDIPEDQDWVKFTTQTNGIYEVKLQNLAPGVDSILELYDSSGVVKLSTDDSTNQQEPERIVFDSSAGNSHFALVYSKSGSANNCDASYEMVWTQISYNVYMPIVRK